MFEFFFKYPITVFTKGKLVLLGAWPGWLLAVLILAVAGGLASLIWYRLKRLEPVKDVSAATQMRRAAGIWGMQTALLALVLLLLWQPAIVVAELKSQQNLIAVLVDGSRSMAIADSGSDGKALREAAAFGVLKGGMLAGLQKRFQTRVYQMNAGLKRVDKVDQVQPTGTATHINAALKQLAAETSDLPVGAVVVLSDGAENSGGIDLETVSALRNRRLPVHTVGFGKEQATHDVEIEDVSVAPRAMAESRMRATVSVRQFGYQATKVALTARDGEKVLAAKEVTLPANGIVQAETMFFNAGAAGVRRVTFAVAPLPGEENVANNSVARLISVNGDKRRILYVEGEPRWEYKFIRRAADDDKELAVVTMLRTTENKIYRQGISDPTELADGFPNKAEDLFRYDGIIIGSVEAGYFSPRQQELLREYVDQRGGGVLFLGGRYALSDGGWGASGVGQLMPTFLPNSKDTFHRDAAFAQLTAAGADSPVMRLVDDPGKNVERWKTLPYLMDYQDPGNPKPGATVLAEMTTPGHPKMPLLVTQSYGRGRTGIMATSGSWRWQMSGALGDPSHDLFWQQLLRWVVADSPGRVVASMPEVRLMDDGHLKVTATVRDKAYVLAPDAKVSVHMIGPDNSSSVVDLAPVPSTPGSFAADWTAEKPGAYVAEVTAARGADELGRDVLTFERQDGVAENFHTEQNRELLEKLASETGGHYWGANELDKLSSEISFSEAGISVRNTKELWNMPIVFLVLLGLMAGEWLLRRKWGMI